MDQEPIPISERVDQILDRVLPPEIAAKRIQFLKEHADEVLALRDTAKRAWEMMLTHEMRVMLFDGMSPRVAEQAAKTNLGVRKAELAAELEAALQYHSDRLAKRMQRLMEELEDVEGYAPLLLEESTDAAILELLRQAQAAEESVQRQAWDELQRYRTEALQSVKEGEDRIERELRVALARGRLKERLRELLKK